MEVSLSSDSHSISGRLGTAVIIDTTGERDGESEYLSFVVSHENEDETEPKTEERNYTSTQNKQKKQTRKKKRLAVSRIVVDKKDPPTPVCTTTPKFALRKPATPRKTEQTSSSTPRKHLTDQVKVTEFSPRSSVRHKIKTPRADRSEYSGEAGTDAVQVLKPTPELRKEALLRKKAAQKAARDNAYRVEPLCIDTARELLQARTALRVFEPSTPMASPRNTKHNRPRQELTRISKAELLDWLTFAQTQIELATVANQISCNTTLSSKDDLEFNDNEHGDFDDDEGDDGFFVTWDREGHEQKLLEQQRIYDMVEGMLQRQTTEAREQKNIRGPPTPRYRVDAPRTPRELVEDLEPPDQKDDSSQKLQLLSEVTLTSDLS